jgi:transcriptional antiterminator RfaH
VEKEPNERRALEAESRHDRNHGRLSRPSDPATEYHWYCVKTRPKAEHIARASLVQMEEVEAYCPRIRFQRSTARGKVWFTEALFPGYLFARFIAERHLRFVSHANGVTNLLKFGGHYATLPSEIIDSIQKEMEGEEVRQVALPPPAIGSEVEVASGPFRGMDGIVTNLLHGGERVKILIQMFGELNEVEIRRDRLVSESHRDHLGFRSSSDREGFLLH